MGRTGMRIRNRPNQEYGLKPAVAKALEEGDLQGVADNLTLLQRRFCEEYLVDFNGKEAVLRAGYKSAHPNKLAHQILKNPAIRAVLDYFTEEKAGDAILKPDYVIQKITKTIEKAELDNNHGAVLRGCELLARHLGMFIERTEISGPDGEAIKYERVREAADAFTSAIAGLTERGAETRAFIVSEPRN